MRTTTRESYRECVQAAVETLARRLDAPLALADLAERACLSPFHFHRVFRGMVGESPGEFQRRLRLERAAYQLRTTDRAITDIAFEAGYGTHEAFIRAFRQEYNHSPSAFRRNDLRYALAASCSVHFDPKGLVPHFVPRDTGGNEMQVDIVERPALRTATVSHTGPYNQIPAAFGRLCEVAGPAGLFQMEGAAVLGIYYDDPESTPAAELRSDAAIILPEGVDCPAPLVEKSLPAGRYARTVHIGPYDQLGDTWARFMGEWLPNSGYRFGQGAAYELYVDDPNDVPKEQLRTDLYISVE